MEALKLPRSLERVHPHLRELNHQLARCYNQIGRHEEAPSQLAGDPTEL
jgi:hypothetical protein